MIPRVGAGIIAVCHDIMEIIFEQVVNMFRWMVVVSFAWIIAGCATAPLAPQPAPWQHVGTYHSQPHQTLEEFVSSIAYVLADHTKRTRHEVCGMLGENNNNQFAITLGTSQSQIGCQIRRSHIPEGFVSLEQTVHSHPPAGQKHLTSNDLYWSVHTNQPNRFTFHLKEGPSSKDRQLGPGWLVNPNEVVFFQGKTTRRVGVVVRPAVKK